MAAISAAISQREAQVRTCIHKIMHRRKRRRLPLTSPSPLTSHLSPTPLTLTHTHTLHEDPRQPQASLAGPNPWRRLDLV